MKHKNYDAEQMYKEYMQNINSDPSAIEDILSGERESSHTGARIKRSTGKMVGITAAAAAIAICAGIGFSNLSRNDIQPASSLTQQNSANSSAIEQSEFGDFELKSENIFIAKRGIKTTLTLTAKDDKARKTLQKYTNKKDGTCNFQLGCINTNGYAPSCELLDETGYHYEQSSDCIVSEIADDKVVFDYYLNLHKDLNKQLKLTINAYCPSKIQPTADEIANGIEHKSCLASIQYELTPNSPEYEFKADNGEYFCLSPFYYRTNHDVVKNNDISAQSRADLTMTFRRSNGNITSFTGKDFTNIGSGGIHSDSGFERQNCFTKLRDISDISEIVYGGQVFRLSKQQKHFNTEITDVYASDHGLRVFVKVTALTDDAKKMIREQAETIKNNEIVRLSPTSADAGKNNFTIVGTSVPVFNGDSFTAFINYELVNSTETIKDGTKTAIRIVTPDEYIEGGKVMDNNTTEITIKKNMTERVFKSASGKTLWLSDFQFNCNMDYSKMDKQTFNNFEMTFADGTVKTPFNMQCGGAGGLNNGEPNIYIAFYDKIDSTKVISIKYAGEVFTAK